MKTGKLAAALMLIPPQMLFATVYYASPDGTGTGDSAADPCSIVNGFTKLNGNAHTLVLAKGRYLLLGPLALSAVQSSTEQTVVMGETGNPADVILDAQGASEVMRINYSKPNPLAKLLFNLSKFRLLWQTTLVYKNMR